MSEPTLDERTSTGAQHWLRAYYALRGAVSLAWVAAALTVGTVSPWASGVLLVVYPAWDAMANVLDARRNGGLRENPTQAFNTAVSSLTTIAVAVGLTVGMHAVIGVFGVWAALSGLLQLATAVRRWRTVGAQWLMILSGAQSAAAGAMFLVAARAPETPSVVDVAPYAAFGAFYFLASAVWLVVSMARSRRRRYADMGG
ncbi:DUF308 domain-containing protein [Mycolicibacterium sediminis]|uniref:Membrane protein n=1 Tax=Mycolicibacterium sediminis TaxID=1286180 RepID=A0A7I7QLL6_9MYCO|nr:DUF308 domain-containing protein [Mycolicibacterium sediminis]BBY26940.1 membrane protein [Mycolicibacterium sediminis]